MTETIATPAGHVAVSPDTVVELTNALLGLVAVANPALAGSAAAVAAGLKIADATLIPLVQQLFAGGQITRAQQSLLAAYMSALRAEVGASSAASV